MINFIQLFSTWKSLIYKRELSILASIINIDNVKKNLNYPDSTFKATKNKHPKLFGLCHKLSKMSYTTAFQVRLQCQLYIKNLYKKIKLIIWIFLNKNLNRFLSNII